MTRLDMLNYAVILYIVFYKTFSCEYAEATPLLPSMAVTTPPSPNFLSRPFQLRPLRNSAGNTHTTSHHTQERERELPSVPAELGRATSMSALTATAPSSDPLSVYITQHYMAFTNSVCLEYMVERPVVEGLVGSRPPLMRENSGSSS